MSNFHCVGCRYHVNTILGIKTDVIARVLRKFQMHLGEPKIWLHQLLQILQQIPMPNMGRHDIYFENLCLSRIMSSLSNDQDDSLLSEDWTNVTKISTFACFIYCAIGIIIQLAMLTVFIVKVMCKQNNTRAINSGLIYLCFTILLLYFTITCNDMLCIIVYVLTQNQDLLEFYHFWIAIEWNVAIILQYAFFLYRLWLITITKYRSKCIYYMIFILTVIQISCRAVFSEYPFIGLTALTIWIVTVCIIILYIFYRLLHGILVNNDESMVRNKLSMAMLDDNSFENAMNAVRVSIGLSVTKDSQNSQKDKVIEIFCEIFCLCLWILFINVVLGVVATMRWYQFKSRSIFWMQSLWVMDITAQIINSLSVFLQFKATMPCYFKLCGICHRHIKAKVVTWIYADARFSVNNMQSVSVLSY